MKRTTSETGRGTHVKLFTASRRIRHKVEGNYCFVRKRNPVEEKAIYTRLATIPQYSDLKIEVITGNPEYNFKIQRLNECKSVDGSQFSNLVQLLQSIHQKKVIHADIKRDHLRLNKKGEIVLIDFGEAFCPGVNKPRPSASLGFTALDVLLYENVHALDDLQSAVLTALHFNGWGPNILESQRDQAAEQLQFLAYAFDNRNSEADPYHTRLLHCFVYLQQLPRSSEQCFDVPDDVYAALVDPNFTFSNADVDENLLLLYQTTFWAKVYDRDITDVDEIFLSDAKFFDPGEYSDFYNSQVVLSKKGRKCLRQDDTISAKDAKQGGVVTEIDGLFELFDNEESTEWSTREVKPAELLSPYTSVTDCAGFLFVSEISQGSKSWDDLSKKLRALLPIFYRPLHILRTFAGLGVVCRGLPTLNAPAIAQGSLSLHVPLAVLVLSGRLSISKTDVFYAGMDVEDFRQKHTETLLVHREELADRDMKIQELGEENQKLDEENQKLKELLKQAGIMH